MLFLICKEINKGGLFMSDDLNKKEEPEKKAEEIKQEVKETTQEVKEDVKNAGQQSNDIVQKMAEYNKDNLLFKILGGITVFIILMSLYLVFILFRLQTATRDIEKLAGMMLDVKRAYDFMNIIFFVSLLAAVFGGFLGFAIENLGSNISLIAISSILNFIVILINKNTVNILFMLISIAIEIFLGYLLLKKIKTGKSYGINDLGKLGKK